MTRLLLHGTAVNTSHSTLPVRRKIFSTAIFWVRPKSCALRLIISNSFSAINIALSASAVSLCCSCRPTVASIPTQLILRFHSKPPKTSLPLEYPQSILVRRLPRVVGADTISYEPVSLPSSASRSSKDFATAKSSVIDRVSRSRRKHP